MVASRARDDTDRSVQDRYHPLPLPPVGHPDALAHHRRRGTPRHHDGSCGKPGGLRDARRVREAARRNGTAARPSPRSGPTFTTRARLVWRCYPFAAEFFAMPWPRLVLLLPVWRGLSVFTESVSSMRVGMSWRRSGGRRLGAAYGRPSARAWPAGVWPMP
jgi:hypothetical protein